MTEKKKQYHLRRWLGISRTLTIRPEFLEYGNSSTHIRFEKEDIESFRYGVTDFRLYFLPISRTFQMEIKNSWGSIMRIRTHSFFGIRTKKNRRLFLQIHGEIHTTFFVDMAIHYLKLLQNGLAFELAGILLTSEGVLLRKNSLLIPWDRVGLATYYHSCSVYDLADPGIFRAFDFWYDWNASLLSAVVDYRIRVNSFQT